MNKLDVQQRVSQNGEPLSLDKFEWDEKAEVFSTTEDNLVLDFNGVDKVTFNTGSYCNFKTGYYCTFNTGFGCTFKTGSDCVFKTGSHCNFNTGSYCTFDTGSCCNFDTNSDCTFDTGSDCTFKTGEHCVVVRRDVYEVIELKPNETTKLHVYMVKGFSVINETEEMTMEEVCKELGRTIKIKK